MKKLAKLQLAVRVSKKVDTVKVSIFGHLKSWEQLELVFLLCRKVEIVEVDQKWAQLKKVGKFA